MSQAAASILLMGGHAAESPDAGQSPQDPRHALGRRGENLAAMHLRSLGFSLLARNARTRYGEIDLIAFDGQALVFVEVKTRSVSCAQREIRADQRPLGALSPRQRARLRWLATAWLRAEGGGRPTAEVIRFDAIGVIIDDRSRLRDLEHVQAAW